MPDLYFKEAYIIMYNGKSNVMEITYGMQFNVYINIIGQVYVNNKIVYLLLYLNNFIIKKQKKQNSE